MKTAFNRISAVILSLLIVFGALPFTVLAADFSGECGENLSWEFVPESGILTVTGTGDMEDYLASRTPWYSVRTEIKSVKISSGATSIGNNAFYGCSVLNEVSIPGGLTDIGENAFRNCAKLADVKIPDSVKTIGAGAFYASGIKFVNIPAAVSSIGSDAFGWCASLEAFNVSQDNNYYSNDEFGALFNKDKSTLIKYPNAMPESGYVIPATVTSLADNSFENCYNLKVVSIPENVTSVGSGVFFNCYLENIIVSEDNPDYSNDALGVLYNKDKTVLILYPVNGKAEEYQIPSSVQSINADAFHNAAGLKGLTLSDGITEIGDYSFLFCENLTYIHIPASVTSIGEEIIDGAVACICSDSEMAYAKEYAAANGYSFKLCQSHGQGRGVIASGTCGETALWMLYNDGELVVSGAGKMTDYNANGAPWANYAGEIKKLTVNSGITYISENAFYGCESLAEASIPTSVMGMGASAFEGCTGLISAFYGGNIENWCAVKFGNEFSNPAYYAQKLYISDKLITEAVIPENVTEIGAYVFAGYEAITDISFGGAEKINDGAFMGCSFTEIIIPEQIESIGAKVFADCADIRFIHIPASVKEIGNGVIDGTAAIICSDSETAYAKEYAAANGYTFKLCKLHRTLGVSLTETEKELFKGSTHKLEAVVYPENALNINVTWKSDNPSVAYVDENGVVSAVSAGSANITVTTEEGGFTASCSVTVKPRVYKITWISDGTETFDFVEENGAVIVPDEPQKTGYKFIEWTPEVPQTMPATDLIFEAKWQVNSYSAVFDANGGAWADGSDEKEFFVEYGKRIHEPEFPAKQGYAFAGWSTEIGVMDSVDGKRFAAVWESLTDIKYTVKIHTMELSGEYTTETKLYTGETDSVVNAEYTEKEGFAVNAEKSVLSGSVAPDGSLVLEIYFDRIKYSVSINGEELNCVYGDEIGEPTAPAVPEGYHHDGWVDENGNTVNFPLTVGVDVPLEISPKFTKNIYTVTWIVDDVETAETYEYQQKIVAPSDPVKHGYLFKNWTPSVPENMPAGDMTFTAIFEKIIYTCSDCGEKFDDETKFNEHVAYEQAKKAIRVSIKNNPGTAKIKYGETIKLTAVVTGLVSDAYVYWYVDGVKSGEGETFELAFKEGTKTVEVKIVDGNGNVISDENGNEISDSQQVTVNSSFWQKIVSFFKNLFRMNRTVTQTVKNIIY